MGSQLADLQDCAHQSVHQRDSALEGLSRAPGFQRESTPTSLGGCIILSSLFNLWKVLFNEEPFGSI
jgi:hypothetical protein